MGSPAGIFQLTKKREVVASLKSQTRKRRYRAFRSPSGSLHYPRLSPQRTIRTIQSYRCRQNKVTLSPEFPGKPLDQVLRVLAFILDFKQFDLSQLHSHH
jgi:hypothetical protein